MGENVLDTSYDSNSEIDAEHTKQFATALNGNLVPRLNNTPNAAGLVSLGTSLYPWRNVHAQNIVIDGRILDFDISASAGNKITPPDSTLPVRRRYISIDPDNPHNFILEQGFRARINGLDVETAAPITFTGSNVDNSSAFASPILSINAIPDGGLAGNDASPSDVRRYWGEKDFRVETTSTIPDYVGPFLGELPNPNLVSPSTFTDGELIALTGHGPDLNDKEIVTARYRPRPHHLMDVERGVGYLRNNFQSRNVAMPGVLWRRLRIGWAFLGGNGVSVFVTYVEPKNIVTSLDSGISGQYGYEPFNDRWFQFTGTTWSARSVILIGRIFMTTTGPLGYDVEEPGHRYSWHNNIKLKKIGSDKIVAANADGTCSVMGVEVMARNLEIRIPVSIRNTRAYLYLGSEGRLRVREVRPKLILKMKGHYHPVNAERCIGSFKINTAGEIETPDSALWPKYTSIAETPTSLLQY